MKGFEQIRKEEKIPSPPKLLLISAALFFIPSVTQAMDPLPPQIIEDSIVPKMDRQSLINYGSTSKANAAALKKYRQTNGGLKDIILTVPSVSEVLEIFRANTPKLVLVTEAQTVVRVYMPEEIALGTQKWHAHFYKEKTPHNINTKLSDSLQGAQLMRVTFEQRQNGLDSWQMMTCRYENFRTQNPQEMLLIWRTFPKSAQKILFQTCKPINLAYEQHVTLDNPERGAPPFVESINMHSTSGGPLPDGLQLICAQEKIPNKE